MSAAPPTAARAVASLPPLVSAAVLRADPPPDRAASATVVGSTLVAFTSDVTSAHKTELLYLLGFVQLQATQNFGQDPRTDPVGYYDTITRLLTGIGFGSEPVSFARLATTTPTVTLAEIALETLGKTLTPPELALVEAAVLTLRSSADERGAPWVVFDSNAVSSDRGSFAIGVARETTARDGRTNVALTLSAFALRTTGSDGAFLWTSWSSTSIVVEGGGSSLVLDDDLWNLPGVASRITSEMQQASEGYIAHLPPLGHTGAVPAHRPAIR